MKKGRISYPQAERAFRHSTDWQRRVARDAYGATVRRPYGDSIRAVTDGVLSIWYRARTVHYLNMIEVAVTETMKERGHDNVEYKVNEAPGAGHVWARLEVPAAPRRLVHHPRDLEELKRQGWTWSASPGYTAFVEGAAPLVQAVRRGDPMAAMAAADMAEELLEVRGREGVLEALRQCGRRGNQGGALWILGAEL